MPDDETDIEQTRREVEYYRRRLNELAAESLKADYVVSGLRKKAQQTRRAFGLLSHLPRDVAGKELEEIFGMVLLAVNTSLGMDKTVILSPADGLDRFKPSQWTGFTEEGRADQFAERMSDTVITFPSSFSRGSGRLLVNRSTELSPLMKLIQDEFELPFYVAVPVVDTDKPLGIIISGRMKEAGSIFPPLDESDITIFESITGVIEAAVQGNRLIQLRTENERKAIELEHARRIEKAHEELQATHRALKASHEELKTTQEQLIHAEKMASFGQLTAGIAHEIKNPLNFVNNFAEMSAELLEELVEHLADPGYDEHHTGETIRTLLQNAELICRHGRRADGIVSTMMQHASGGIGEREDTDINELVSQHVDLAYHGSRAGMRDLHVEVERALDPEAGYVNLVPQDIGRVILNLLDNAFDAVQERASTNDADYRPKVTVETRCSGNIVQLHVADNGPGIPVETRNRIFEPFFTTKPTGTGTGLGLSLSYDIVCKGHGGSLTVESDLAVGTRFVIELARATKPATSPSSG